MTTSEHLTLAMELLEAVSEDADGDACLAVKVGTTVLRAALAWHRQAELAFDLGLPLETVVAALADFAP